MTSTSRRNARRPRRRIPGPGNVSPIDRSHLPPGASLEQADGTAWMAYSSIAMLTLATTLAEHDATYDDMVVKFLEQSVLIMDALEDSGCYDADDGFFYDRLTDASGRTFPVRVQTLVRRGRVPAPARAAVRLQAAHHPVHRAGHARREHRGRTRGVPNRHVRRELQLARTGVVPGELWSSVRCYTTSPRPGASAAAASLLSPSIARAAAAVHHLRRERRLLRPYGAALRPDDGRGRCLHGRHHRRDLRWPSRNSRRTVGEPGAYGLGQRVPMLVISPWSKGGYVDSEVLDHTSIIRFLERRFGVTEPNIAPWRRAVCGDLTSAFDFTATDDQPPALPPAAGYLPPDRNRHPNVVPVPPAEQRFPGRNLAYAAPGRCPTTSTSPGPSPLTG